MAMQSMKFQSTTSMKGGGNKATNIAKWKNSLVVIETIQVTNKPHHHPPPPPRTTTPTAAAAAVATPTTNYNW
jgi:hypothetical protein